MTDFADFAQAPPFGPWAATDAKSLRKIPRGKSLARIHTLENEVEAMVLHDLLQQEKIPHIIESYRDTAYDGLFQAVRGWGGIIVREEDAGRAERLIRQALEDLFSAPATPLPTELSEGDE